MINELNGAKSDCAESGDAAVTVEQQAVPDDEAAEISDAREERDTGGVDGESASNISHSSANTGPEREFQEQESPYREDFGDRLDTNGEKRSYRRFWRFRTGNDEESRDKLILSRIRDEDLMEYLALEQRRVEFLQQTKETKEKRILDTFRLVVVLAAIVAVTYFLQDSPTILISILYVAGIVAALNVWRNPQDKGRKER